MKVEGETFVGGSCADGRTWDEDAGDLPDVEGCRRHRCLLWVVAAKGVRLRGRMQTSSNASSDIKCLIRLHADIAMRAFLGNWE